MSLFLFLSVFLTHTVIGNTDTGQKPISPKKFPRVLLVHFKTKYWGGIENHTLNRYKMLIKNGYYANILVAPGSLMESVVTQLGLPSRKLADKHISDDIYNACKELAIDIIMCPSSITLHAAKKVAKKLPLKIIGVRHVPVTGTYKLAIDSWKKLDGVIAVSPEITAYFNHVNKIKNLGIKNIMYIPPFFDEDKFFNFFTKDLENNFLTRTSQENYFKEKFNITFDKSPENTTIACMIGNMYANVLHKNHGLLLQAIRKLIIVKNKSIHVMIAGSGDKKEFFEKMAHDMGIGNYVHFLGFVADIPTLLHNCDIHVLTSNQEAFGQVHVEAGLMKKPSIGATKTGATAIIIPDITGLLFNNGEENDLVNALEKLIDNPAQRKEMGEQAYTHVRSNFSNDMQFKKLELLLEAVAQS